MLLKFLIMKKIYFLSVLLMLVSCSLSVEKKVYGKGRVSSVSVEEFAAAIGREGVQLVDVRTAGEYAAGSIDGSINIDVNSGHFGADADSLLDKEQTVAVYCRSGRRSKKAAEILSMMGFDVVELDKGYNGWIGSAR